MPAVVEYALSEIYSLEIRNAIESINVFEDKEYTLSDMSNMIPNHLSAVYCVMNNTKGKAIFDYNVLSWYMLVDGKCYLLKPLTASYTEKAFSMFDALIELANRKTNNPFVMLKNFGLNL